MRTLLVIGIIFFVLPGRAQVNYRDVFTFDYTWAIDFTRTTKDVFDSVCYSYNNDADMLAAIVFPELIRYNMVRNYFETAALNALYVRYGSAEADFSIGYFQIKPSFAERIEQAIGADTTLSQKYLELFFHNKLQTRQERLTRLNDLVGALVYLNAFCDLMEPRVPPMWAQTPQGKLRYLATAYNCGFDLNPEQIEDWMNRSVFPYGPRSNARQYNYAEISWHYYQLVK